MTDTTQRPNSDITGFILAGGRGRRMGGADKGWVQYRNRPLITYAMERLQPQVSILQINANRHIDDYRALGVAVYPDVWPDFAGPLAGLLTALQHSNTPLVATIPCDCPAFPLNLVATLYAALDRSTAKIAVARTSQRVHPVFCLCHRNQANQLTDFLQQGHRRMMQWLEHINYTEVMFPDEAAFTNLNHPNDDIAPIDIGTTT